MVRACEIIPICGGNKVDIKDRKVKSNRRSYSTGRRICRYFFFPSPEKSCLHRRNQKPRVSDYAPKTNTISSQNLGSFVPGGKLLSPCTVYTIRMYLITCSRVSALSFQCSRCIFPATGQFASMSIFHILTSTGLSFRRSWFCRPVVFCEVPMKVPTFKCVPVRKEVRGHPRRGGAPAGGISHESRCDTVQRVWDTEKFGGLHDGYYIARVNAPSKCWT